VILVDANLLLYAYHPQAHQHEKSRAWLEAVLSGRELVRFAWLTVWAFLRIGTNSRVFEHPLTSSEAEAAISSWLAQPVAGIVEPGERHWEILRQLIRAGQAKVRWSWMPSLPPSQSSMALRSARRIAIFRDSPMSNGRTRSQRPEAPAHRCYRSSVRARQVNV
jgi:toxin-antitoxin system PIN domain toxin